MMAFLRVARTGAARVGGEGDRKEGREGWRVQEEEEEGKKSDENEFH